MTSIRWFKVTVLENDKRGTAYFYETNTGMFDLQYGFGNYTTRLHDSLRDAISEFRESLQAEHTRVDDGIRVSVGTPVEVTWDEVKQNSPSIAASDSSCQMVGNKRE